jgi:AraC-like DNA-binding protein
MIVATHLPRPPLNQFVEMLWFHEGYNCGHRLERVLPDGSMELIIYLRDEDRHVFDRVTHRPRQSYRRSWLSGPHSEFIIIDTACDASMIGVHFRPGGAKAFFGFPLDELRNSVVDLDAIWNGNAQSLREHLLEAPNPAAKFRILEEALLARWRRFASRHRAVVYALECFAREPHGITIGQVTNEIGLSARRFIEVFTQQVGMTPKMFCRVRRFQHALAEIHRRRDVVWAEIATASGYYDQAHFINNFREFCGITPVDFLEERPEYPNFIPIRGG